MLFSKEKTLTMALMMVGSLGNSFLLVCTVTAFWVVNFALEEDHGLDVVPMPFQAR